MEQIIASKSYFKSVHCDYVDPSNVTVASLQTDDPKRRLTVQDFVTNEEEGNSGPYINYREVFARFELSPGHYVIIPATFEPHRQGSFMIRVYTDCPFDLR